MPMAMDGVWKMTEDGEFELQEPYATYLAEAKMMATYGWMKGLFQYLQDKCPYTEEQLMAEMERRVDEEGMTSMQILEEFVIEAVSGDLIPL